MLKPRKTPLRKCTGCLNMKNKKDLVRVVRNADGTFSLDIPGKAQGRGAYICKNADCLLKAIKQKGLERSFKTRVPPEVYETLKNQLPETEQPNATE